MYRRRKRSKVDDITQTWEYRQMSESMEVRYRDLLNPTKNADEAINIPLAEQLLNYLQTFVNSGDVRTNFNSAALLIQGSSCLYGKKVDHLFNLASNLHETLTKHNLKEDQPKKKDPKEKAQRQSKILDPFCSTEIKVGKNLSCLRQKNIVKRIATKKSSKKKSEKKHAFVPVDLLPLECEEKGDVFYDTRGEAIGNKNDYTLNKCRITTSGWLLLPTVSPDTIVTEQENLSLSNIEGSPAVDEGYPTSSGCTSSPPTVPPSQTPSGSQQTDEGLGGSLTSTPSDGGPSQPEVSMQVTPMEDDDDAAPDVDMENIPLENFQTGEELAAARKPLRRSLRNALQQVQLQQAEAKKKQNSLKEDLFAVRRPIEKNNTVCYPPGMRNKKPKTPTIYPASVYCARTFFAVDDKVQKKDMYSLQVKAFANNTKFINKFKSYTDAIKAAKSKRRANGQGVVTDSEEEVEIEDGPESTEEDHSFAANPGPLDDDFDRDSDIEDQLGAVGGEENPLAGEVPNEAAEASEDGEAEFECDGDDFDRIAEEQMALFRDDLQTVEQTAAMASRVRKWEKGLKPFLEDISKRDKFDIHLYGSRILDAFDESNRRQTMLFRDFCKGKEKYEIHRYFLALLPLANVGNVSISNELCEDGQEGGDIEITLLSRKMHHMELEEFGHNDGQHN